METKHDTPQPQQRMVTVCAWCPDGVLKTREAVALGLVVSHTMCPACVQKFEEHWAEETAQAQHTHHFNNRNRQQ